MPQHGHICAKECKILAGLKSHFCATHMWKSDDIFWNWVAAIIEAHH